MDGMIAATDQPAAQLCTACFTGRYPIELPSQDRLGKHLLEQNELPLGAPEDGLLSISPATGGASALEHP
jgi:amidophosphoribosyltransferase